MLVPLFYLLLKIVGRRLRPLSGRLQEEEAGAIAMAQENLGMLPAIKTYTREPQESARYREQIDRILRLTAKQRRIYAALGPAAQLIAAVGIVLVLALASSGFGSRRQARAGATGELSAVRGPAHAAGCGARRRVRPDADGARRFRPAAAGRWRSRRNRRGMSASRFPAVQGGIEFRGVSFGYRGGLPRWKKSICISRRARPSPSSAPTARARAPSATC